MIAEIPFIFYLSISSSISDSWKPTSINEEEQGVLQYSLDAELVAEYKNKGVLSYILFVYV